MKFFDRLFRKKRSSKIHKEGNDKVRKFSSNLGNNITSISTAKEELYHEPINYNPSKYVCKKDHEFFGITSYMNSNDKRIFKPLYIPKKAINHKLFVGYTRSGKGVIIGNCILETLRNEQGLIYVDVKQEDFIPQIIKEELIKQNREDDFLIMNYPNDFGYSSFNDEDTIIELWEKISTALEFNKVSDPAVEHYRGNQRMTLLKVLEILYNPKDNIGEDKNPKDWYFFMDYVRVLFDDLDTYGKLQKELQKENPNQSRVEKYSELHFSKDTLEDLKFNSKNIEALETIYMKTFELLLNANIYTKHSIKEALYNKKVLYFKCDMENLSSLQMLKTMYVDISQTVRREKAKGIIADCHIVYDEISFYVDEKLSGGLSVLAGFGINCSLLLQDLGQIEEEGIKNSILSNSTVKLFYKISDKSTLDYVTLLGGEELVTKYSKRNLEDTFAQDLEPLLNTTRIRAMWYTQHAILIAEYFNTAKFIETDFVKVKNPFDWNAINNRKIEKIERPKLKLKKEFTTSFENKKDEKRLDAKEAIKKVSEVQKPNEINISPEDLRTEDEETEGF